MGEALDELGYKYQVIDTSLPENKDKQVEIIPVLIVYVDGKETARLVGFEGKNKLLAWLRENAK